MTEAGTQRLDKWLWCARFFKSRGLANKLLGAGRLRLSGKTVTKAHQLVRGGDVLTFPQGPHIRVVKVLFLAERRGPAPEAQLLYEDLAPIQPSGPKEDAPPEVSKAARREPGSGRPTKRERRKTDQLRSPDE
ncbi:RNA-binding S4 domain-containing protein [Nisaea sediminum]|uniref:RNA-binding S4 domain-containing protein n=1 Tax=Nisaea sediminum TaxID=2775867 RepID=UPI001868B754|nr:RNA-binding S4 domain-containing protein [Nisaea sediminum]